MAKLTNKVTRAEIFAAAEEIAAAGERPTLEGIRQRVGGSFTTLGPALREWHEQRAARAAAPQGPAQPPGLRERLEEFGSQLWAEAAEQAGRTLESQREELERTRRNLEAAQAEVAETADRLAVRVEELQARCAALEGEAGQLREELEGAREASAREAARAEAERRLADELRAQLAATRESLCADLAERVAALEQIRDGEPGAPSGAGG